VEDAESVECLISAGSWAKILSSGSGNVEKSRQRGSRRFAHVLSVRGQNGNHVYAKPENASGFSALALAKVGDFFQPSLKRNDVLRRWVGTMVEF